MRFLLLACIGLVPLLAEAKNPPEAERFRLETELAALATKSAWDGVERTYEKLIELDLECSVESHLLAAKAARDRGEPLKSSIRLKAAVRAGAGLVVEPGTPIDEAMHGLQELERRYGRVRMRVGDNRLPILMRAEMPFAPDQRASIRRAQVMLAAVRGRVGWDVSIN